MTVSLTRGSETSGLAGHAEISPGFGIDAVAGNAFNIGASNGGVFAVRAKVDGAAIFRCFSSQKRSFSGGATRLLRELGLGSRQVGFLRDFLLSLLLLTQRHRGFNLHLGQEWMGRWKIGLFDFLQLEGALWCSGCTRLLLILRLTKTNEFIAIVGRDDSCT
jgi:hypothetical protein